MAKFKDLEVENITLEAVPPEEKKSWLTIAFIWAGQVVCVPALLCGALIASGLTFKESFLAMVIGYGISVVLMMLIATQAAYTGRPSVIAVTRALGTRGSQLSVSLVLAISMVGWFAYNNIVCAESFVSLLKTANVDFPVSAACIILGALMLLTAFFGIGLTKFLNIVGVPLLLLFMIYAIVVALKGNGVETLMNYVPEEPISMTTGITISVGGFIAGAATCGDYNRYSKDAVSAVLSSLFGIIPLGVGALLCGAVLAITTGNYDITVMFANVGMPIIGLLVLILATWTTNVGNAYSAGIDLVNILKLKDDKRALVTLIAGIVGILLSLGGIVYYFVNFLSMLSYLISPICAILVADYWIIGKGKHENWEPFEGVNWLGIIAWLAGAVITYFDTFFVPEIIGIIGAMIIYTLLCKLVKNPKINPFA